jgi:hypothetical protein
MSGAPPGAPPKGASAVATDTALGQLAYQAGFGKDIALAVAVALAESSGQCWAVSSSGDYGLWQINYSAHQTLFASLTAPLDWANPQANASMAAAVYSDAGNTFKPWTTYTTGAYSAFLLRGQKAATTAGTLTGANALAALMTEESSQAGSGGDATVPTTPLISTTAEQGVVIRLVEIFLGSAMLLLGVYTLTKPITGGATSLVKSLPIPI